MIRQAVFSHRQGVACVTPENERLTWARLHGRAASLAGFLRARRISRLLIYGPKGIDFVICIVACLFAGTAYIPVDPSTPSGRLLQMVKEGRPDAAVDLSESDFGGTVPPGVSLCSFSEMTAWKPALGALPAVSGDDLAYILFTSGSTGAPKGVCVTYANLENFLRWFLALPAISSARPRVALNQAHFSFDLSVADLYYTLTQGGLLLLGGHFPFLSPSPENAAAELAVFTPSFADFCLLDDQFCAERFPALQTVFFCGEVLRPVTVRRLKSRFPRLRVLNAYGPTEATCAVSAAEITDGMLDWERLPMGKASGEAVRILPVDEQLRPLPEGEEGRLLLTGESVAAGYLGDGAGFFAGAAGPSFLTGDVGKVAGGLLWFSGRADDQIKYMGYRVEPAEVEAALCRIPGIRQAAVLPCRLSDGRVAGLTAHLSAAGTHSEDSVLRALKRYLPPYMLPKKIIFHEALPLTPNGKIDRRRLITC